MRYSSIRLSRRHEWCVYAISAAVFGSGAGWAWFHFFASQPDEFGGASSGESWMLKLHGAAAMLILVLLGTLLPLHMKFAWRARRNVSSGLSLLALFGFLVVTGYGLYYVGGEKLRVWTSRAHLWVGLALPLLLIGHVFFGKRSRTRRLAAPAE